MNQGEGYILVKMLSRLQKAGLRWLALQNVDRLRPWLAHRKSGTSIPRELVVKPGAVA